MEDSCFSDLKSARRYLKEVGKQADSDIDLFETALALSLQNHRGINIDQYRSHFRMLCDNLHETYEKLAGTKNGDILGARIEALRFVFAQKNGYIGDNIHYDDLQNIDMIRVIDRRLGMPVTLCLLAIAVCRVVGWAAHGLNFPGHFLMRLDHDKGGRAVIDPFQSCQELNAPELRSLLKQTIGSQAELSASFYEPCSNRDMLLRLQNNLKLRMIDDERYGVALSIVEIMRFVAPGEYRLDLDRAVLLARLDHRKAAATAIKRYIDRVPDLREKQEAQAFLRELEATLN